MRRTSPSTRIIGGNPADRWRSEAPCLALKARSSVISMRSNPFLLALSVGKRVRGESRIVLPPPAVAHGRWMTLLVRVVKLRRRLHNHHALDQQPLSRRSE